VPDRSRNWLEIPASQVVRVLGSVGKPGRYQWHDGMSLLDLLAEAGGPTAQALQDRILVVNLSCCTQQARVRASERKSLRERLGSLAAAA
jgi:protein involved in polysaccharide export with SLBB domain